jgi:hypothetical protein
MRPFQWTRRWNENSLFYSANLIIFSHSSRENCISHMASNDGSSTSAGCPSCAGVCHNFRSNCVVLMLCFHGANMLGHTEILDKSRGFPFDVTANVKIWFNFLHFFTWLIQFFFHSFLPSDFPSVSLIIQVGTASVHTIYANYRNYR